MSQKCTAALVFCIIFGLIFADPKCSRRRSLTDVDGMFAKFVNGVVLACENSPTSYTCLKNCKRAELEKCQGGTIMSSPPSLGGEDEHVVWCILAGTWLAGNILAVGVVYISTSSAHQQATAGNT